MDLAAYNLDFFELSIIIYCYGVMIWRLVMAIIRRETGAVKVQLLLLAIVTIIMILIINI